MCHSQCLEVLVEHTHDVLRRVSHHTVNLHSHHHHHGLAVLLPFVIDDPLRLIAAHVQGQRQRLRHVVAANQVNLFVVRTYINIRRNREGDGLFAQRVDDAAGLRSGDPYGQVLQFVTLSFAAQVIDGCLKGHALTVGQVLVELSHTPSQRIAIDIDVHRDGACHQVALQVGHFLHSEIDIGLLDGVGRFLDVHEQLVVVGNVTEIQVLQLRVARHRCIDVAVHEGGVDAADECVAAFHGVSLVVLVAFKADACRLQTHGVVVLPHRTSEVQVSHERTFRAHRGVVGELVEEFHGQHALEHAHLVDVAGHHVGRRVLVHVGGTQCDVVSRDACQVVGCKDIDQVLVNIDACHVA